MTLYVCPRAIARLLLLAGILLPLPVPAVAQSAASTPGTPTLAERLDRLAAEIERNRVDLHVPGVALAIVRGDEVIFARGFGLADVAKKTPVTPRTPFFIGSTTKAFTATLVGMLVDEGRMGWDDPVEKYLPGFKLAVQSKDPNDRATIRDVLSHRTGFTRNLLEGRSSSEEILRQAASAEAFAPFRQRFLYNNMHYLAAGSAAAAAAAGSSWDALIRARILTPLGMAETRTSMREAWTDPRVARGYRWDDARQELLPASAESLGLDYDGIAPAGTISSSAVNMTAWLRFLLRRGAVDGKALVSPGALSATWTPQIQIGGGVGYGMGWFVRSWRGQRLIEHGGAVVGFSSQIGLLPDSDLGFVLLTNTMSSLPSMALQLVPQYLLGELPRTEASPGELSPYLGRYIANFAAFSNEVFTISQRNGRLVLDVPSQFESALNPPGDDGRWPVVIIPDQLAVSFDRDGTGRVVALRLHEGGHQFPVPREGIEVKAETAPSELQKYLGAYRNVAGTLEFTVLVQNQQLAVRLPNGVAVALQPPDGTGRRGTSLGIAFDFEESAQGAVMALNVHRPGALPVIRLLPAANAPALPTVDEIMTLRGVSAQAAPPTMRTAGRVRFPQSGVDGRFTSSTAGNDRLRLNLDIDRVGKIQVALDGGRAWRADLGTPLRELTGKELTQTRLGHPAAVFGDWRKYYDAVRVVRAGELEGRKVYVVRLESAGMPAVLLSVDAETGDVLQDRRTLVYTGVGAIPTTTTYADYRVVDGIRIPHRSVESNDQTGRTIYEVERVELGVALEPSVFTLPPSP